MLEYGKTHKLCSSSWRAKGCGSFSARSGVKLSRPPLLVYSSIAGVCMLPCSVFRSPVLARPFFAFVWKLGVVAIRRVLPTLRGVLTLRKVSQPVSRLQCARSIQGPVNKLKAGSPLPLWHQIICDEGSCAASSTQTSPVVAGVGSRGLITKMHESTNLKCYAAGSKLLAHELGAFPKPIGTHRKLTP